jgi:uncharacterized protein YkwD
MKPSSSFLLVLASSLIVTAAHADIAAGINKIRSRGCGSKPGVPTPFKQTRGLDEIARAWSRGGRLQQAIEQASYRVVNSASMRVEGTHDERVILDMLSTNYCKNIVDASYTEMGIYQKGDQVWIVVGMPFVPPSPGDAQDIEQQVLVLVNRARAKARKCGTLIQQPVPPLTRSAQLDVAALAQAQDMATHNFFEHRGSDGSNVADRVTRAGYLWQSVGENIAAGPRDAESAVKGWLDSPGHCANIMGAQYKEMGLAYATDPKSRAGIYWSQVFASALQPVEQKPAVDKTKRK